MRSIGWIAPDSDPAVGPAAGVAAPGSAGQAPLVPAQTSAEARAADAHRGASHAEFTPFDYARGPAVALPTGDTAFDVTAGVYYCWDCK